MRTFVDLLQIALALTLPVLLMLAVAKRRRRDLERHAEMEHPGTGEIPEDGEFSPPNTTGPSRSVRRPGAPRAKTIDLGHDRALAHTLIAALESQGVEAKLSERSDAGADGRTAFKLRYKSEDDAVVRKELLRAFDVDD